MSTAELIARCRALVAYDLDSTLGPLPDPDDGAGNEGFDAGVVSYLNEASLVLARSAYLTDPAVALALTAGVGRYRLDGPAFAARVLVPYAVVLEGRRLANAAGNDYGLWTANELALAYPTWMSDASGTPTKAAVVGGDLVLHPTPISSETAYVDAQVAPARLSADALDAVPDLPEEMHPGIAAVAVYRACLPYSQSAAQVSRLNALFQEATATAEAVGRASAAARLGNGSTAYALRQERVWM